MKKSLYKKFYITFLTVVLAGGFLLSSMVLVFTGNYMTEQHKSRLLSQSQTLAFQIGQGSVQMNPHHLSQYTNHLSYMFSDTTQSYILVVNNQGEVLTNTGLTLAEPTIPPQYLERFLHQSSVFTGNMKGMLSSDCAVGTAPIELNGNPVGVVFSVMPLNTVGDFLWDILQMLFLAALLSVILVSFGAYAMASALVKPLTQMSKAAGCLAQGDFSHRIHHHRTDEIGQLADAFNQMTLALEAGEKMRYGFVANVSHELKTPMTTISGFVDGMIDGTIPPEDHEKYLNIVSDEVKRLSRLVNTMLNLSKLESGETPLHPTPFDLRETVLQAMFMFETTLEEKNIQIQGLEEFPSLPLTADKDLTHQAIYNLVENSVKYTPCGGEITITGAPEKGQIRFCIRNTGEGIEPEHLPFVFDRFYKVDQSRSHDKNSLGLGLYLVKTIVSLHHGQITVRSRKQDFCEFEMVLPTTFNPHESSQTRS